MRAGETAVSVGQLSENQLPFKVIRFKLFKMQVWATKVQLANRLRRPDTFWCPEGQSTSIPAANDLARIEIRTSKTPSCFSARSETKSAPGSEGSRLRTRSTRLRSKKALTVKWNAWILKSLQLQAFAKVSNKGPPGSVQPNLYWRLGSHSSARQNMRLHLCLLWQWPLEHY